MQMNTRRKRKLSAADGAAAAGVETLAGAGTLAASLNEGQEAERFLRKEMKEAEEVLEGPLHDADEMEGQGEVRRENRDADDPRAPPRKRVTRRVVATPQALHKPKRFATSYAHFCSAMRQKRLQAEQAGRPPPYGGSVTLTSLWRSMSTEQREPWEEMSKRDVDRYKRELKQYEDARELAHPRKGKGRATAASLATSIAELSAALHPSPVATRSMSAASSASDTSDSHSTASTRNGSARVDASSSSQGRTRSAARKSQSSKPATAAAAAAADADLEDDADADAEADPTADASTEIATTMTEKRTVLCASQQGPAVVEHNASTAPSAAAETTAATTTAVPATGAAALIAAPTQQSSGVNSGPESDSAGNSAPPPIMMHNSRPKRQPKPHTAKARVNAKTKSITMSSVEGQTVGNATRRGATAKTAMKSKDVDVPEAVQSSAANPQDHLHLQQQQRQQQEQQRSQQNTRTKESARPLAVTAAALAAGDRLPGASMWGTRTAAAAAAAAAAVNFAPVAQKLPLEHVPGAPAAHTLKVELPRTSVTLRDASEVSPPAPKSVLQQRIASGLNNGGPARVQQQQQRPPSFQALQPRWQLQQKQQQQQVVEQADKLRHDATRPNTRPTSTTGVESSIGRIPAAVGVVVFHNRAGRARQSVRAAMAKAWVQRHLLEHRARGDDNDSDITRAGSQGNSSRGTSAPGGAAKQNWQRNVLVQRCVQYVFAFLEFCERVRPTVAQASRKRAADVSDSEVMSTMLDVWDSCSASYRQPFQKLVELARVRMAMYEVRFAHMASLLSQDQVEQLLDGHGRTDVGGLADFLKKCQKRRRGGAPHQSIETLTQEVVGELEKVRREERNNAAQLPNSTSMQPVPVLGTMPGHARGDTVASSSSSSSSGSDSAAAAVSGSAGSATSALGRSVRAAAAAAAPGAPSQLLAPPAYQLHDPRQVLLPHAAGPRPQSQPQPLPQPQRAFPFRMQFQQQQLQQQQQQLAAQRLGQPSLLMHQPPRPSVPAMMGGQVVQHMQQPQQQPHALYPQSGVVSPAGIWGNVVRPPPPGPQAAPLLQHVRQQQQSMQIMHHAMLNQVQAPATNGGT